MIKKEEIKVYKTDKEMYADYKRFRKEWEYNRDEESGVHKSGLKINKVFMNGAKFQFPNLQQWMTEMKEGGLTREEANLYLSMLKNQFVVINEKEPYVEKELTLEEKVAEMEKDDNEMIELVRKQFSEEKIKELAAHLKSVREEYYRNGGRWLERFEEGKKLNPEDLKKNFFDRDR